MIGSVFARQARTLTVRSARTRNFSRKIVEEQKAFQGGSTPYLRGEADPTYLRMGSSDAAMAVIGVGTAVILWMNAFSGAGDMMYGKNKKEI